MSFDRHLRWATPTVVLYIALYAAWTGLGIGGPFVTLVVSDLGSVISALAAGVAGLWAARRSRSPRHRKGWFLLGAGCTAWGAGEVVWSWYEIVRHVEVPFPGIPDIGYLTMIPLAGAGVVVLSAVHRASVFRQVVDGLMVGGSLLFVSWVLVLERISTDAAASGPLTLATSIAYPLGDVVILTVILLAATRTQGEARRALVLVSGGMAALALADSGFLYLVNQGLYESGHVIDNGWVAGFLFVAVGALHQAAAPVSRDEDGAAAPPGRFGALLPSVAVAVGIGFAAHEQVTKGALEPVLFWMAIAVIVLMLTRHAAIRLELNSLTRHLEAKVRDRTAELRRREQRFRALVANSSDVVVILDEHLRIGYVSDSVEPVFGYRPTDLVGREVVEHVHEQDRPRIAALGRDLFQRPTAASATLEYRIRHRDGSWRHVESTFKNLTAEQAVGGLVLNTRDITERRALEEELSHRAFHDSLTGLPNRALLTDRVAQAIARAARRATPVTVLYLDLDGFKGVNDTFGHAIGDRLIQAVAGRLASSVRAADTVARFGGDEFGVLLDDGSGPEDAATLASRILAAFETPFAVGGRELVVSASIGIASTVTGLEDAGDLLRNADVAMYRAKADGRGRYEQFDPEMHLVVRERLELEADLRRALERGELFLDYQPVVDLRTSRVVSVEALVRWRHPSRGVLSPASFVPLAEESGLVVPLGAWVLSEACRQLGEWRDQLGAAAPSSVGVNLSVRQFRDPQLLERVADALRSAAIEPDALCLEITESFLVDDPEEATATLHAIKELGVTIAIDDFGVGYSSLSYLQQFPIDVLKIDRTFVQGLGGAPEDAALARAIVKLARTFHLRTVGEGIEFEAQAGALRAMGCDLGQGYLFARPLAPGDLERMLRRPAVSLPVSSPA